jgi:meso-butanediol dehydrogenase/(S,S)-butanediol dehydrogenase/diacetyl reductase
MKLAGKVALVTGGTVGIGEAVVRLFSEEGAGVAFCGRRSAPGVALERALSGRDRNVMFVQCDASNETDVTNLMARVVDRFGALNIVVNNAGIAITGRIEDLALESWREVMESNVTSMFLVSQHAIPLLRAAGGGSIINLGSTYGMIGVPGSGAYAASKAAAISLAKTLALELASDGIRANALCPGATATPLNIEWLASQPDPQGAERDLVARHPIGRLATPLEQARAALFLASDDASYVTGHAFLADGGFTAQ